MEKHVPGCQYRILVVEGKMAAAPGDLVVVFYEKLEPLLEIIREEKRREAPLQRRVN